MYLIVSSLSKTFCVLLLLVAGKILQKSVQKVYFVGLKLWLEVFLAWSNYGGGGIARFWVETFQPEKTVRNWKGSKKDRLKRMLSFNIFLRFCELLCKHSFWDRHLSQHLFWHPKKRKRRRCISRRKRAKKTCRIAESEETKDCSYYKGVSGPTETVPSFFSPPRL